jgi:hypothetical protein
VRERGGRERGGTGGRERGDKIREKSVACSAILVLCVVRCMMYDACIVFVCRALMCVWCGSSLMCVVVL